MMISGVETSHRSFANITAANNREPLEHEVLSLEQQVMAFLKNTGIEQGD